MALSSTFEANFDQFVGEAKRAELALHGMATAGTTATTSTAKLATASTASTTTLTSMAAQLRVADQSMASFGVSISPVVNAVTELGGVAGKSASELGALGTATAVAAAAMAGWNIGRWIADLTGADEAIAGFTARLFGMDDASEIAGNNLDLMNRAIGKGFTGAVDDFLGASKFLQQAAKDNAEAINKGAKEAEKAAKAQQQLQDALFGYDLIAKAQAYVDALVDVGEVSQMSAAKQAEVNAALGGALDAYTRLGVVGPQAMRDIYTATLPLPPIVEGLEPAWNNVGTAVKVNADAIIADLKRMEAETKAYEDETQRLVDEWNKVKPPIDAAAGSVDGATAAVGQLTVQMQNFGRVNQSVWEEMASGLALMEAYGKTGVAMGAQTATGGYTFGQITAPGITPTSATAARTLTVNVNNADAQGIANKLVTEMRHQGVRF